MPKFTYTGEDNEQLKFELLKAGDYPFELVALDTGFSTGSKTRGCEQAELKLKFFTDATFTKPLGQWTETLTFPDDSIRDKDTRKFLTGRLNMFAKSTGIFADVGDAIEIDEHSVGLRGWAAVVIEARRDRDGKNVIDPNTNKQSFRNKVDFYRTDKPKLERAPRQVEEADPWA